MKERIRKGKNWYIKCDCGNWKAEKAKQCLECVQAKRRAKMICPKCGGKKNIRASQCHTCASKAKKKPGIWTCPECGESKDSKATTCWNCYQATTYDGPTHCSNCGTALSSPWNNTTGFCLDCCRAHRAREPNYCVDCDVEIAHGSTRCRKCAIKNQFDPSRRYYYNDRWFRSNWEVRTAYWLDTLEIPFEYEQRIVTVRIDGKSRYYLPDFYIPKGFYGWPRQFKYLPANGQFFIEVKGYLRDKSRRKMQLAQEQHPELALYMFQHDQMEYIPSPPDTNAPEQLPLWPTLISEPK